MPGEKVRIRSRILGHSTIGLLATELLIHNNIVCIDSRGLRGGLDLSRALHAVTLRASGAQRRDEGYDKKVFHTANIGNAGEFSHAGSSLKACAIMGLISTVENLLLHPNAFILSQTRINKGGYNEMPIASFPISVYILVNKKIGPMRDDWYFCIELV